MLTGFAIEAVKMHIISQVAYLRYHTETKTYEAPIESAAIAAGGSIEIVAELTNPEAETIIITGISMHDFSGRKLAEKPEK